MNAARRLIFAAGMLLVLSPFVGRAQAQPQTKARKSSTGKSKTVPNTKSGSSSASSLDSPAAKALQKLTQQLKEKNSAAAYAALSKLALEKSSSGLNTRAALALGF